MASSSERPLNNYDNPSLLPPWEERLPTQVPYVRSSSTRSGDSPSPPFSSSIGWPTATPYSSRQPQYGYAAMNQPTTPWGNSGPTTSLPYETPVNKPGIGMRNASFSTSPQLQSKRSHSTTRSTSSSSPTPITAMPGTMSARAVAKPVNSRPQPEGRIRPPLPHKTDGESALVPDPRGASMRSRFKGFFKRNPSVEDEVESIRGHHWTDEDY